MPRLTGNLRDVIAQSKRNELMPQPATDQDATFCESFLGTVQACPRSAAVEGGGCEVLSVIQEKSGARFS